MDERIFKIVLEALVAQIDRLKGEMYCKEYELEKLKEENAELKRQRDALCRKENEDA